MKTIKKYIDEQFNPAWDAVVEMASIGSPILNKEKYLIAVHGVNACERSKPHIHIYLNNDFSKSKFNFEIALDEIICYDEINLIRQKTAKKDITNRNKCSWDNYNKLHEDFEDWLFMQSNKRGDFIDNLDAIIYYYNEESSMSSDNNHLLAYIQSKGMKVNNKYYKYFSEIDKEEYKDCF